MVNVRIQMVPVTRELTQRAQRQQPKRNRRKYRARADITFQLSLYDLVTVRAHLGHREYLEDEVEDEGTCLMLNQIPWFVLYFGFLTCRARPYSIIITFQCDPVLPVVIHVSFFPTSRRGMSA